MTPNELLSKMGSHPTALLGLRSSEGGASFSDPSLDRWLVVCCLLGRNVDLTLACASARALDEAGLALPSALAKAGPLAVESALVAGGRPAAPPLAFVSRSALRRRVQSCA